MNYLVVLVSVEKVNLYKASYSFVSQFLFLSPLFNPRPSRQILGRVQKSQLRNSIIND